jgi:polyphosphate kinase 2 (PPK2 family)
VLTGWSLIDETDGFDVDNDVHDDPVLVGPDGQPVTTWQEDYPYDVRMTRREYEVAKRAVQIELLKLQAWVKDTGQKVVLVFEGRDAAGKGGTIKRFTEHLNPRGARVVALEKPTDRERGQWYFQRYVSQLPSAG